jgi:hypothetical protein
LAVVVLVVDYVYQVLVLRWLYPREGLLVAVGAADRSRSSSRR